MSSEGGEIEYETFDQRGEGALNRRKKAKRPKPRTKETKAYLMPPTEDSVSLLREVEKGRQKKE